MNDDVVKGAWQAQSSQTRLVFDADTVLKEVERSQKYFNAIILRRDQVEIRVAILLVPTWIVMGWKLGLPWTWYLTIPGLLWIAGFMLFDRLKHRSNRTAAADSLRQSVQSSLHEVQHQIRLLRNVLWWYVSPIAIPVFAFFGQIGWEVKEGGLLMAAVMACFFGIAMAVFVFVFAVNRDAIRNELEPRRQELQALLDSLDEGSQGDN